MSNGHPLATVSAEGVEIRFPKSKQGLMKRLLSTKPVVQSFTHLGVDHQDILFAIADLRNWQDQHPDEVDIKEDQLRLSHDAAAYLSTKAAELLGLPSDVHLTLKTDVTGVLGKPDFKLAYEWSRHGRRETPKRVGAFLNTAEGARRIPLWMKRAIDLSDNFDGSRPIEEHWSTLAAFRQALEPDDDISSQLPDNSDMAALSMTAFLRGLEVRTANRFSISPDKTLGQFEVVPYSAKNLNAAGVSNDDISESDAELCGEPLAVFQHRLRTRGARPAYQLGGNSYLVIDRSSAPILEEMARVQQADRAERKAFIDNPRVYITEAVNRHLSERGALEGLDAAGQEELVESIAGPALIESREYSERVTGVTIYTKPAADFEGSGTAWLPEVFDVLVSELIRDMPLEDLQNLQNQMQVLIKSQAATTTLIGDNKVEVTPARLAAVTGEVERRERESTIDNNNTSAEDGKTGPIILDTLDNFETLSWHAKLSPRKTTKAFSLPEAIITPLRNHQHQYFSWATKAWASGLPGILNADEQGLGKTLQTIAFLNWLQIHMSDQSASIRGPILIVAPTSLLLNWEEEVERHVAPRKFGRLTRLYGSHLSGQKRSGARGTETGTGLPLLDLDWLEEAFEEGRAHRHWILTTYTTLANYQHSLGKIPFAALVMDEIQNIKNHSTIASKAVEAMNADFRIGLTGTPIENSTMDIWTIMDRIAPGSLGAGSEFKSRFGTPDADNMAQLHGQVFNSQEEHPPLGLRRLKEEVARDLPSKTRYLHPRLMPKIQAETYDIAQQKLGIGGPGAALKMLHHIRSVSVHPGISEIVAPEDFVGMSARLSATMEILDEIKGRGERALIFIEHRNMQFQFAELVRYYFGLEQIKVINGDTPIPKRQEIVNHFQRHLTNDCGFDMLILGPKSAGTGLTLTAATNVIHLSRWWNPAVEEQCNDRVHRIGQTKPVEVHVPLAIHPSYGAESFDCLLQSLMQRKRKLASQALWPMGDTKDDLSDLHASLASTAQVHSESVLSDSMKILFERDSLQVPKPHENGSYIMP